MGPDSLLRQLRWPLVVTVLALVGAAALGGFQTAVVLAILAVLEISLSFDNAVVNVGVLERMSPRWQRIFLTVGLLIAVFGMRMLFPLVLVGVASGVGPAAVLDLAISHPDEYQTQLEAAHPSIAAFGGIFLLMVSLDFLFQSRDIRWLAQVERALARAGAMDRVGVLVALVILVAVALGLAGEHQNAVLLAGVGGLITYLTVKGLSGLFAIDRDQDAPAAMDSLGQRTGRAALFLFLYVEVRDASFSFDGVVGAFALSSNIFVIAAGLGVGAMYMRGMTLYLVRQRTLAQYVYLEHGAHYAIGALAMILLASIRYDVPEPVTGLMGTGLIALAFLSSRHRIQAERRRSDAALAPSVVAIPDR